MPIPYFRCAKCKKEHPTKKDTYACEDGHLEVAGAKVKQYSSTYQYPYLVEVTFTNGVKKDYYAEEMR